MNKSFFIQIKAAFLLLVFSLNTLSGFACALGVDMRLGSMQHSGLNRNKAQVVEEAQSCHSVPHPSSDEMKGKTDNDSRNCCGDKMIRFDKLDKTVVKSLTIVNPVFLKVFVSTFFDVEPSPDAALTSNIRYFDRSHHLPVPDIRVIIQSFQV